MQRLLSPVTLRGFSMELGEAVCSYQMQGLILQLSLEGGRLTELREVSLPTGITYRRNRPVAGPGCVWIRVPQRRQ
jgi:hypothetical protein